MPLVEWTCPLRGDDDLAVASWGPGTLSRVRGEVKVAHTWAMAELVQSRAIVE